MKLVRLEPFKAVVPLNTTVLVPPLLLNAPLLINVPVNVSVLLTGAFNRGVGVALAINTEFMATGNPAQVNVPELMVSVPIPEIALPNVAVPFGLVPDKLLVTLLREPVSSKPDVKEVNTLLLYIT